MGVDMGFDIGPAFEDTDEDNKAWEEFLADVVVTFADDPNLIDDPENPFIVFAVGEHPRLARIASCALRFSSKVSGSCGAAESYIHDVKAIARRHFGMDRVHAWDDWDEMQPYYSWTEVYAEWTRGVAEYRAQRLAQKGSEPAQTDPDGGSVPV